MGGGPIRFLDVEIDPGAREVRRGGEVVPVQKRVFELLAFLIENRDRAVGKDELQERVWPGVIVTETALTRAVMKARRAVGDDSDRQAVIRTVHGHGYRFVAPMGPVTGDPAVEEPAPESLPSPTAWRPAAAWGAVGTVALLGLVAVAALLSFNTGNAGGTRIAVLPVEDRTGDPDLAWAGLGLMSYANRLFAEGAAGDTVPARRVMAAAESVPPDVDTAFLQDLRQSLGASHLIHGVLSREGDSLLLEYRVVHEQGGGPAASLSGIQATELAREMTRSVISTLPGSGLRRDFRTVSADPFVNEAYARGLALQLKGEVAQARVYFEVAVRQEPELFWPRYELALCMRDMGELDAARENLEALVARTARSSDAEMRTAANNALAQVYWRQREFAQADQAYTVALEAAQASGDPVAQSDILVNRGILARITGDLEAARRHLATALEASDRAGDPDRGSIYQSLGQVEWAAGELPLALDYYRRAHDAFRNEANRRGLAASLNAMARVERRLGRFADAEQHMQVALAEREAIGDFFGRLSSRLSLAELYGDMERWAQAHEHADQALALAEEAGHEPGMADALRTRAYIALVGGDPEAARADLARLDSEFPDDRSETLQGLLKARLAFADGDAGSARAFLEPVLADGPVAAKIDALDILGTHAADISEARRYWREALDLARAHHERARLGRILMSLARRELAEGNTDEAKANAEALATDFGEWQGVAELREQVGQPRPVN